MKATLDIPDALFKKVKAKAAMEGLKIKDLVSSALAAYLTEPRIRQLGEPKACPFPLVRGEGGPLLKQMSKGINARLEEDFDLLVLEGSKSKLGIKAPTKH